QALEQRGVSVTQGTLSRDLVDIGATRIRTDSGQVVYQVPAEPYEVVPSSDTTEARLSSLCKELLLSAEGSATIAVLRTPPRAAPILAAAVGKARLSSILGETAGDEAIMVVRPDADGGPDVASDFIGYAEQEPRAPGD